MIAVGLGALPGLALPLLCLRVEVAGEGTPGVPRRRCQIQLP